MANRWKWCVSFLLWTCNTICAGGGTSSHLCQHLCSSHKSLWDCVIQTVQLLLTGKPPLCRTACSQVQSYLVLHRAAMFEHHNPQPSFFPNFNSCRCCHFPQNNYLCNVLHTNPKRAQAGGCLLCTETFVRPSKGSRTWLMIKHCFNPSLWRVSQYLNCMKRLNTHIQHKLLLSLTLSVILSLLLSLTLTNTHICTKRLWEKKDRKGEYSPFCSNLQINPKKRKGQGCILALSV